MNIDSNLNNNSNNFNKDELMKNSPTDNLEGKSNEEKIDYSKYITFSYIKKDKSYLNEMLTLMEENDNKLNNEIVTICSDNCFANLNCDFLSGNENICLINCFKKFSDTIQIGEKLIDELEKGNLRKTLLIKGDYDMFRAEAEKRLI